MNLKTFLCFTSPSLLLMLFFIALPLVGVFIQSFYVTGNIYRTETVEKCTPGFSGQVCVEEEIQKIVLDEEGNPVRETRFVGLDTYRKVLQTAELSSFLEEEEPNFSEILDFLSEIDFFRALRFTLTFTLGTLPLVIFFGLLLALAINTLVNWAKGPIIFISLLPFIITPVIGAISIKWLFIGDGILTALMEYVSGENIAVFANGWAVESLIMFYRVWHVAPFAFVIFYAGLQSLDRGTLEAAVVDGANRMNRLRHVIIPHLFPLIVFVALIHLMDAFRVFEEIIGFSAQAHRISLQFLTFDFLTPDDASNRAVSSASASSMLTMIGIVILLIPMLMKTWKDNKGR